MPFQTKDFVDRVASERSSSDASSAHTRGSKDRNSTDGGRSGSNRRTKLPEHEPLLLSPSYANTQTTEHTDEDVQDERHITFTDEEVKAPDETKSITYLILLSCCMGGLQLAWSVELASISPFLLELGLSKSILALVWIAGPLSGTLVQPYIGIRSDDCRLKMGRRRPFMIGGAAATALSLLALAWTENIISGFLSLFGISSDAHATRISSQVWAVLLVYILDIGINVLQAGNRAFIVDCAPTHQQESANAIANVVTGIGGIVGYLCGQAELTSTFSHFGDSQFKILCVIACIILAVTVSISCLSIKERDPHSFGAPTEQSGSGVIFFFKTLYFSINALPPQIKKVCIVQIFNWVGWFPFLFYTTTYVGALYAEPFLLDRPDMSEEEINDILDEGVRRGTHAMFVFSIITLAASILLPLMIAPTYTAPQRSASTPLTPLTPSAHLQPAHSDDSDYFPGKAGSYRSQKARLHALAAACSIRIPWLTIRRAWILSHIAFASLIWLTLFTSTPQAATLVIAAVGIPWALTNWAPFALIAAEISKRDAIRRGLRRPPPTRDGQLLASGDAEDSADQAGVVLGIHNVAVAAPQVVATLISSVIFKALQKPRGATGDHSIGWVLRLGGLCALGAAWFTRHINEGDQDDRQKPGPEP